MVWMLEDMHKYAIVHVTILHAAFVLDFSIIKPLRRFSNIAKTA
jgi:hypothetical protein